MASSYKIKAGVTSSNKMFALISQCVKKSLDKENKKQLDLLIKISAKIEYMLIQMSDSEPHVLTITSERFHRIENLNEKQKRCLKLIQRGNNVNDVFFDVWRELGVAIRSLIIGDYNNISRSLRWMIESLTFWADVQTSKKLANEMFDEINNENRMSKDDFSFLWSHLYGLNQEILKERLLLKREYNKPTFGDILKNLSILTFPNNKKTAAKWDSLKTELNSLYAEFSGSLHPSINTLLDLRDGGSLRNDFAFYMDHYFEQQQFNYQLEKIWRVIDLITSIIIMTSSRFYHYATTFDFIQTLVRDGKHSAAKEMINYSTRNAEINYQHFFPYVHK